MSGRGGPDVGQFGLKSCFQASDVGGSSFSLGSLTRGPLGSSGALSAGADPYLLNLLYNGAYQAQPLPAETFSAQQLYQQQCQARQAGDAARQHAGLQLGGFGLPAALPGGGALYGMPSVHAPHAAVPLASERVKERLGEAGFAAVRRQVMAQQEVFVQQMYDLHRVATRQRHLQTICERPQALRAEIALQVTEDRQRKAMASMQARAREAQDAPRRQAWQAKADAKERVWRQEQAGPACAAPSPASVVAARPPAALPAAGSGTKLEEVGGEEGFGPEQGLGQGSGQGSGQGLGSGQGSGQGLAGGSGQGSPKPDSKSGRSSDTGSAADAAAAPAKAPKPSQHAQSLLHEAAPAPAPAHAQHSSSPNPHHDQPGAGLMSACAPLQAVPQLHGYAGPLGGVMPVGAMNSSLNSRQGAGGLPIPSLHLGQMGGSTGTAFGGYAAPAPFFNPYCMMGAAMAPDPAALLGFDPLASWYAHHYGRAGFDGAAGAAAQRPVDAAPAAMFGGRMQANPMAHPSSTRQPQQGQAAAQAGAAAAANAATVTGVGALAAPPVRWWQDPAQVMGAEVLAGTLAPQPAPGAAGGVGGVGRRTEACSRPACREDGAAPTAPVTFLPPLKQRSKRARHSASGTDCDEVGQSAGAGTGSHMPSPSRGKSYAAGASDVPMSLARSGSSAFRKVPQRRHGARSVPARADSIGSENSKSSFAACAGASDVDSGLPRPKKALTSAASILVSFAGNA